jgi:hypothetical protein
VRTKLAKQFGVSEHKVQQALNVQKADHRGLPKATAQTRPTSPHVAPCGAPHRLVG